MNTNHKQILANLLNDESGQDLIEYALIAALIALVAVSALGTLANSIKGAFNNIATNLNNAG